MNLTKFKKNMSFFSLRLFNKIKNNRSKEIQFSKMIATQAVAYSEFGDPNAKLKNIVYKMNNEKLKDNQVLLKTLAFPINPSDINQIQGVYPSYPEKKKILGSNQDIACCGNEGLFEVISLKNDVKDLKIGDWVIPLYPNFGTWRTHAISEKSRLFKIPNPDECKSTNRKSLSVVEGATLSVNPITAYLMLTEFVKLDPKKDWVIQNGGNSSVGRFVIQMCRILGFNSISIIREKNYNEKLVEELKSLGATKIITTKENDSKDFSKVIDSWVNETNGSLKLALNCVGGKNSSNMARKLSKNGVVVTYGGMSYEPFTIPTSLLIFKNIKSYGFWVTDYLKDKTEKKKELLSKIIKMYNDGLLKASKTNNFFFKDSDDESLTDVCKNLVMETKAGKSLIVFK